MPDLHGSGDGLHDEVEGHRRFAEGLDVYRDTLRTPLKRRLNLRRAERSFLEASAEDQNFDLAYYNLGVVYRDLGKPEAAYSAFLRTIELNPKRLEAYYALAANRWREQDYEAAVLLCDRVIDDRPTALGAAESYNLKSLALAHQEDPEWSAALKSQRQAVANARRALLRSSLGTGDDRERAIEDACVALSTCLMTLAFVCRHAAGDKERRLARAEALIEQAVKLDRSSAQVHFSLGDVRDERGRPKQAADAYRAALEIAPRDVEYWAHLARALARADARQEEVRVAAGRALESPYTASQDTLNVVAEALDELGDGQEAERVRAMKKHLSRLAAEVKVGGSEPPPERVASMSTFLSELADQMEELDDVGGPTAEVAASLETLKRSLADRISSGDWDGRAWERAQTEIVLGYLATRDEDWHDAEQSLEAAIDKLKAEHSGEIGERGLGAELARLQLQQTRRTAQALASAEKAIDLDPLSPKARGALAEVRSSLGEWDVAKEALEIALLRAPEAPEAHLRLGECTLELARRSRDGERRNGLLREAAVHLAQALDLYPSDQLRETARTHELLGLVHLELCRYEDAIARFEVVRALQPQNGLASLEHLGRAYMANGDYPRGEAVCQKLIEQVGKGDLGDVVDRRGDVAVSRGELLGKANLQLAKARVERDVDLDHALELVRDAKRSLGSPVLKTLVQIEAECWACEGLVLYKQGKLDEALERLERAALLGRDPRVYLHLAMVCAEKVECAVGSQAERTRPSLAPRHTVGRPRRSTPWSGTRRRSERCRGGSNRCGRKSPRRSAPGSGPARRRLALWNTLD